MAEKQAHNSSQAVEMQAIAEAISKNEGEILERWMLALKLKVTLPKDLLSENELRKRSAEFLRSLQVAVRKGDLANVEAEAWEPLKSLLRDTFAARAAQGISPSDGAYYMFALKDTLTAFFQKDAGDRPASFKHQLDLVAHLLEQLGLYAFEAITRRREERPSKGRQQAKPVASGSGDTLDAAQLLQTITAFKKGDFSARMSIDQTGVAGKIADTLNDIIELEERTVQEFERISTAVGREGDFKQRLSLGSLPGSWGSLVNSANTVIDGLIQPTTEIVRVIRAVADGDLSQTITLETAVGPLKGEFLSTARVINTMVEQLTGFAAEVTRVAREVGTEGKLGGQATVEGVSGTWQELTENVNAMANNLTGQVRNIAEVTTAEARAALADQFEETVASLEYSNRQLEEFAFIAAHHLHEPTRQLIMLADMIQQNLGDDLPDAVATDLRALCAKSQRMRALVDALRELSRIGQSTTTAEPVSLDACADQAIKSLAARIERTGAELTRDELPVVVAHADLVTQLYRHLIDNALLYVAPGRQPAIRLTAERIEGNWLLGVQDNGIGIAPHDAEKVFAPFRRLHSSDEFAGVGIGLTLCRKIVERHGGQIRVVSQPGEGATFFFTLAGVPVPDEAKPQTEAVHALS